MKYYLSLFLLFSLFFQGCSDENSLPTLVYYWDQTACSDPWSTGPNNSNEETQAAIENYLNKEGIKGAKVISITEDGVLQFCEACFCTTGTRIKVRIPEDQKSKMIALGFQESN